MLGIDVNVSVDVKKIQYPVYFDGRNICVHCGQEDTLVFVDKFGRETMDEIHAFDHIKCKNCGRIFSILWKQDPKDPERMYPSAVEPSVKQEFINLLKYPKIKSLGEQEL